eukprot:5118106-Amphidinium_carterae.1
MIVAEQDSHKPFKTLSLFGSLWRKFGQEIVLPVINTTARRSDSSEIPKEGSEPFMKVQVLPGHDSISLMNGGLGLLGPCLSEMLSEGILSCVSWWGRVYILHWIPDRASPCRCDPAIAPSPPTQVVAYISGPLGRCVGPASCRPPKLMA